MKLRNPTLQAVLRLQRLRTKTEKKERIHPINANIVVAIRNSLR